MMGPVLESSALKSVAQCGLLVPEKISIIEIWWIELREMESLTSSKLTNELSEERWTNWDEVLKNTSVM